MLCIVWVHIQETTMLNHPFSFGMKRVCRELTLLLLALALASVPFMAAQIQITAQLAATSLT
jgi:hypothetical protein